ncbi:MAG: hypothetical protein Q8O53_02105 [Candidatus Moranbacteria bacterium]|nr:hypothetical protein [Candidatus Moranbacteria bacterium]
MKDKTFYTSVAYREKQSAQTKRHWQAGHMDFLKQRIVRTCTRAVCQKSFTVVPSDPKKYCSQHCAAIQRNLGRKHDAATRAKITQALTGKKYPHRPRTPLKKASCSNASCQKEFLVKYWRPANHPVKYCGRACAIQDIGSRPTSPRASRGKAGIRPDISPTLYFFSRWEANYARVLNFLGKKWIHQPRTFQLQSQKYTPDFYLPDEDAYIEIKNFFSEYSLNRDRQFREIYPDLKLIVISKKEYSVLEEQYAKKIKEWEYKHSKVVSPVITHPL